MLTLQQLLEFDRVIHTDEVRREGQREGQRSILLRQLARRFGSLPEAITARIDAASSEEIERWVDRILDAASLDEVFAAP